jgi:quinone-modifying oxidoreductase, subunit QmoC
MPTEAASPPEPAPVPRRQRLRPDRGLLGRVLASGGEDLRKCMQCATCSSVCEILDGGVPGPRKEMLWAQWGLADRLMGDPNLWLCHQCGDCTLRCPRGARPGDVMAALRRECIIHYSSPRVFGRWASRPVSWFWMVLVALGLLFGAAALWQASGATTFELGLTGKRAVFPFWTRLPHWLLGSLFGAVIGFDVFVLVRGARRFWQDMLAAEARNAPGQARNPVGTSLRVALSRILFHDDFAACSASRARRLPHLLVVFGVLALWLTSLWAVTARWNPLLDGLAYPLGFWNPWKLMANLGGLAVMLGVSLMLWERWRRPQTAGAPTRSDVFLLGLLLLIALSGFACEGLHLLRIEPLRFVVYAAHLILILVLVWMLPYSKLAHVVYRTLAMTFAEHTGRRGFKRSQPDGQVGT